MSPQAWAKLIAKEAAQRAREQRAAYTKPPAPPPAPETAVEYAARRVAEQAARRSQVHAQMMDAIADGKRAATARAGRDWDDARKQDDEPMGAHASVTLSPSATPETCRALLGRER